MTTKIGIFGGNGRMGQAIATVITGGQGMLAGATDIGDDETALAQISDVLVAFTTPDALARHLNAARLARKPIVIGTTGISDIEHAMMDDAAREIPLLYSANTSLGINLLAALVAQASARLGTEWDIEVLEMHHRHKKDAPSGTALLLGKAAASGRQNTLPELSRFERFGEGAREEGSIGFASLRGGSVAGDHDVILAADGERVILSHRAEDRSVFARGAVKAALWLAGKPAGHYTMADVLDL